ncbi:MAG: endopeptidase La [Flavobacteriales bacterium]|nr:endopeptidase La [Flavobacteriales bacterium]
MKKDMFLESFAGANFEEESDFFPLLSSLDEDKINKEAVPKSLAILPLRNTVLFPGVIIPITVGRDKSVKLIKEVYKGSKTIGVVSQKKSDIEDPTFNDLNTIGTVAHIMKMLRMPDGNITVIIQGRKLIELQEMVQEEPYMKAIVAELSEEKPVKGDEQFIALVDSIKDIALQIVKESPNIPSEAQLAIQNIESPTYLVNFVCSNMDVDMNKKQELLEVFNLKIRSEKTLEIISKELQRLEMKNEIQHKVKHDLDQQQREYFLNQQLKAIQEELGGSADQEIEEMRTRAKSKKWNKEVSENFEKEIKKLQRMNPAMADYSVQRAYLDLFLDLPWNEYTIDNFDLGKAKKILDRDHFGLEKVKERILEHLAVLKIKGDMKAPILCLYGPPGVGKTSLGKSIAEALGRKYERVSLGGLRDESEIRGHRKTYIGAMPGRIIKSIKKANSSNPVFVLDEIDKITRDIHGDPSSAMLEVLDPEQNDSFHDNYLEVGYDLSKVMFVATANSLSSIQPALRDRMEIIEINGYTIEEKIQIAKKHLLPKQIKEHGLKGSDLKISNKVFESVIDGYTRESGVRGLDKMVAKLVRHVAKSIAMEKNYNPNPSPTDLKLILGAKLFDKERHLNNDIPGVVTGLAWTAVGGDILFIECSKSSGKGKMSITGNLGNVMKESSTIAMQYIKSHAKELGVNPEKLNINDVHLHVPEGATPKDGPSAGITMLTALVSLFTGRKVKAKLAMTGEITLRGKVLPVGGIKEKILAAKRAGVKEIILCEQNKKDVDEINERYLKGLSFYYVSKMNDVINIALI